ncbi:MAG: DNA polymerase III subunit delta [Acetobacteraceae bacterium SCN 69-10]|nr:DNA polymerase III subunit delta [Rhodospirillales bacterium]ODU54796.1 MAG: DNA polymerase III subunit delta [Acetobacteraceae bacterium SCN 69-10]OJY65633.1 MAG: DNA polymerase III subunit delta [Rhodospirillales bacterium 70-18]
MKLEARRIEAFLRDPGASRAVLLYGEDAGLIRERAVQLVRVVAGAADDPFRVVELQRDEVSRIPDEMASMSLSGGRRVVRVRDATDAATSFVQTALAGRTDGLLVLEAPGLPSKGRLRTLLERSADGVAIGCYPQEGRALEQGIRDTLAGFDVRADADALTWLAGQLGADRSVTLREVEKLALYAGAGGEVDIVAARVCVGDLAGLSLEDALFAATSGDVAGTDRALGLAMAEGAAPVGVLRACLQHLQRLQRTRAAMAGGLSASEAAKMARPPVFFRREAAFIGALRLWPADTLQAACVRIFDAERACKRTGAPAEVISRSAVLGLAQRAALALRR